jgi:CheY-like chemotaxis protein
MFTTLVVEDNSDFRQLIVDLLKIEFPNMRVAEAASAEVALKKIERRPPDLAFLDIRLPGISGLELAKKLRKRAGSVVIVLLTSHDIPEYREAAAKHHVDHFLLKGVSTRAQIVELVKLILADRPTA